MDGSIIIVSGQPRSGTSLMMRLLAESGIPVHADESTSYECSLTNVLPFHNHWVSTLPPDTALKVLWPQILHVPPGPKYKVIWMRRNPMEQSRSQLMFRGQYHKDNVRDRAGYISEVEALAPKSIDKAQTLVVHFEALLRREVQSVESFLGHPISTDSIVKRPPFSGRFRLGQLEQKR